MRRIFLLWLIYTGLLSITQSYASTSESDSSLRVLRGSLAKLYWAEEEVLNISEMFKGDHYCHQNATEKTFKERAADASILHLATHALIDDEHPMYSKLVFTPDTTSDEDGFLNTYELYNMDLNADLVVLSACNSGYGRLVKGEGVMSLARGFTYAGCPSIVMSLWQVDDESTSLLMQKFYENLDRGMKKDRALTMAKRAMIKSEGGAKSGPFYWAGFVSTGNTDPVPVRPNHYKYLWFVLPAALIIGLVIVLKIKRTYV